MIIKYTGPMPEILSPLSLRTGERWRHNKSADIIQIPLMQGDIGDGNHVSVFLPSLNSCWSIEVKEFLDCFTWLPGQQKPKEEGGAKCQQEFEQDVYQDKLEQLPLQSLVDLMKSAPGSLSGQLFKDRVMEVIIDKENKGTK